MLDPDNSSFTTAVGKIAQADLGVHKTLAAFNVILETFYGVGKHVEHSYVIESLDPENGLARFHRIAIDTQFVRIVLTGDKPELTADDLQLISDNPSDLDLLTSKLPTECFEFQGFSILRAIDVTQSSQHEYWQGIICGPDAFADLHSVHSRQHQIQYNEVNILFQGHS